MRAHPVLLATDFPPMRGGIAEYLHQLWTHLAATGPATVVTTVPRADACGNRAYQVHARPDLLTMPDLNTSASSAVFAMRCHGAQETLALIEDLDSGPVHAYVGVWSVISHFWCEALAANGIPYSLFAYGPELTVDGPYASVDGWRRHDVGLAERIVASSAWTAGLVAARYPEAKSVDLLEPGVNDPLVGARWRRRARELHAELGLGDNIVLLTVARLTPAKGIDLALRSLAALRGSRPCVRYVVVGDGPDRDVLRREADVLGLSEAVVFTGAVNELDKQALYSLCDIYLMPCRRLPADWEGFGIAFLEAAAFGKPSIGGDVGGVRSAIEADVTGLVVDTSTPEATTSALRCLVDDEPLRRAMGEAGRRRALSRFSWEQVARRFFRLQDPAGRTNRRRSHA